MLGEILFNNVSSNPEGTMVVFENQKFTYGQVWKITNYIIAEIKNKKNDFFQKPIGVIIGRSYWIDMILATAARFGFIYVPLHHDEPTQKLQEVIEDARLEIILCDDRTEKNISDLKIKKLNISRWSIDDALHFADTAQLILDQGLTNLQEDHLLAYFYSSGTTGFPKGIPVKQVSQTYWCNVLKKAFPDIKTPTRVLGNMPHSFDAHMWERLMAWAFSGAIYITDENTHHRPQDLIEFINKNAITDMTVTPTQLDNMKPNDKASKKSEAFSNLRIYTTGEKCSVDLIKRYMKLNNVEIINCYGPTEAGYGLFLCRNLANFVDQYGIVPIGALSEVDQENIQFVLAKPLTELDIQKNNKYIQCDSTDAEAELLIASKYMMPDYLQKEKVGKNRFVDLFDTENNSIENKFRVDKKFFRVGDFVNVVSRQASVLQYNGRCDDADIRLFGMERIEHNVIEEFLSENNLGQAFKIAHLQMRGGLNYLVYVELASNSELTQEKISAIQALLRSKKSLRLVPRKYFKLGLDELFPVNEKSKKFDRKKLNDKLNSPAYAKYEIIPISNSIEGSDELKIIAKIWKEDFFPGLINYEFDTQFIDYGGTSLSLLELLKRIEDAFPGVRFPASYYRASVTIQQLVQFVVLTRSFSTSFRPFNHVGNLENVFDPTLTSSLFCLPGITGEVETYSALSERIKPMYVFEHPWLHLDEKVSEKIYSIDYQEFIKLVANKITLIKPFGVITLAGWSFGGIFAIEIAQVLVKEGRTVDAVLLFDTSPPEDLMPLDCYKQTKDLISGTISRFFALSDELLFPIWNEVSDKSTLNIIESLFDKAISYFTHNENAEYKKILLLLLLMRKQRLYAHGWKPKDHLDISYHMFLLNQAHGDIWKRSLKNSRVIIDDTDHQGLNHFNMLNSKSDYLNSIEKAFKKLEDESRKAIHPMVSLNLRLFPIESSSPEILLFNFIAKYRLFEDQELSILMKILNELPHLKNNNINFISSLDIALSRPEGKFLISFKAPTRQYDQDRNPWLMPGSTSDNIERSLIYSFGVIALEMVTGKNFLKEGRVHKEDFENKVPPILIQCLNPSIPLKIASLEQYFPVDYKRNRKLSKRHCFHLGAYLQEKNQQAEAINYYKKAAKLDENNPEKRGDLRAIHCLSLWNIGDAKVRLEEVVEEYESKAKAGDRKKGQRLITYYQYRNLCANNDKEKKDYADKVFQWENKIKKRGGSVNR